MNSHGLLWPNHKPPSMLPTLSTDSAIRSPTLDSGDTDEAEKLALAIGANVRRLRKQQKLSLNTLAQRSQVSRAMLSQIELGRSTPTITVLWKIATALEVPFSALLSSQQQEGVCMIPATEGKVLSSQDGGFCSRALFPFNKPRRVEFYELRLKGHAIEQARPHPPGTVENLVINQGHVDILVAGEEYSLNPGDAILFEADVAHTYCNTSDIEAVLYLVMTYAQTIG